MATVLVAETLFWGIIILALVVRSWLFLLTLLLALFLWSLLVGITFPLRPIDGVAVQKARRNAGLQVGALILIAIIGGLLSATTT